MGYYPKVILAGREINDSMPAYVIRLLQEALRKEGKAMKSSKILLMGATFKENVKDTRTSPSKILADELRLLGAELLLYDPLPDKEAIKSEFKTDPVADIYSLKDIDGIIIAVAHDNFKKLDLSKMKGITKGKPVLIDIRSFLNREKAEGLGYIYITL
jgi:UDP-N-acetyl-D-mannosaminuronate dehydrogenase